jgi:adenylate cyclase
MSNLINIDDPGNDEIRAQLKRILKSDMFVRSRKLTGFLTYLVDETLAGRADRLKGYSIGIEVFGKDPSFNPDRDTLVRVQASRLRRLLARYYQDIAPDDPIILRIPKGNYAPQFIVNQPASGDEDEKEAEGSPDGVPLRKQFSRRAVLAGGVIVIGVALVVGFLVSNRLYGTMDLPDWLTGTHDTSFLAAARRLPTGPKIAVLPLEVLSADDDWTYFSKGLSAQIIVDLTRFKDLFVLGSETTLSKDVSDDKVSELGADYTVSGVIAHDVENLRISIQVIEMVQKRIVWAQSFRRKLAGRRFLALQSDIAAAVARAVGQPYSNVQRFEIAKIAGTDKVALNSYQCFLRFFSYAASKNPKSHYRVRSCLEKAVKQFPKFGRGWAALSWMYGDEHRYGFNRDVWGVPIAKSVAAAKQAVDIDPDDSFTRQYLANAYFTQGDNELARREIEAAMRLNPNDAEILADAAWQFSYFGRWDDVGTLINKAVSLNPGHPAWYRSPMFLYYFQRGDYEQALSEARASYQPKVISSLVRMAAVHARLGQKQQAKKYVDIINRDFLEFLRRPDKQLRALKFPDDMIDPIIASLKLAGVLFKN